MSYEPGKMGLASGVTLVLVAGITPLFLSVWTLDMGQAATATWLTPLVTGPCMLGLLLTLFYVMAQVPGDLCAVNERLLGRFPGRLATAFLSLAFLTNSVLELRQYAENTLLTVMPALDIALAMAWFAALAAIAAYIGIEPLARAAGIAVPLGLAGFGLTLALLYDRFDIHNLMPWAGSGLPALTFGLTATGLFLGSFVLPILRPAFQDMRTLTRAAVAGIGLGTAVRMMTLFVYTGIFSVEVGQEKTLPFFELARLVYLNRFIQRIESFFILVWGFYGMTIIAFSLFLTAYLLARLFDLPSPRPLLFPLTVVAIQLAMFIPDQTTTVKLTLLLQGWAQTALAFALPAALLAATWLRDRRVRGHAG